MTDMGKKQGKPAAPRQDTGKSAPGKPGGERPIILRCVVISVAFLFVAALLSARLYQLQLNEADEWQTRASNQQLANIPIAPARGNIYDTNMKSLAESAAVWTIEAAPNVMAQSKLTDATKGGDAAAIAASGLAGLLGLDEAELYANLADSEKLYYKVKAKVEKPLADQVRTFCDEQNISGIYLKEDSKRYYPYNELASTVLGFTNADGDGIEGLESYYNEMLAGTPGRQVTVRNAWGGELPAWGDGVTYPAEDGESIVLTLDIELQQIAEKFLQTAVTEQIARERGMVVMMDVKTGAILAIATCPSYDPNDPYYIYDEATRAAIDALPTEEEKAAATGAARIRQWRNKALADTYEPGSVFKVVTCAAAIDSGAYTELSPFYCGSEIEVADRTFGCAQGTAHGQVTLRQALIDSCNVSMIQISAGMGAHTWYDYLNAFGLTEPTGVDLPGEPSQNSISNLVYSEDAMGPVQLASCSFGQSNKFTAMQMITAFSAAVNGGNLVQPHIVRQVLDANGGVVEEYNPAPRRQVISPETSATLCSALEELVSGEGNSGNNAFVAGYHVGGKSGTSQKLELLPEKEVYISSFLGFAPANDPEVAVLVVLDEPEDPNCPGPVRTYYGGRLAGPVVGNIIRESMPVLGITPDFTSEDDLSRAVLTSPKVSGTDVNSALVKLEQSGLAYVIEGSGDIVLGQYPEAYTEVPAGGTVILYTDPALPAATVAMPELGGYTAADASAVLAAMSLNVQTTGAPDSGATVRVVSQSVAAGTEVRKGTTVLLTMQDMSNVGDLA